MKLSIIVPVLNEAPGLPSLLVHLAPLAAQGAELVFVDGGSSDASAALVEQAGCRLVRAQKGRARQQNAGAAAACGDVFLFLHADTRLPVEVLALLTRHLTATCQWGRFDVQIAGRPAMLKVVARMMNWRSRLTGIATGDQAMFLRRSAFDAVGGFPDQPLMEDIELSCRLRRLSPPACIAERVLTSGRRWEERGVWPTIFLMWRLRWAYWRGVSASRLAEAYR